MLHGHTACVSIDFAERKPELKEIESIWRNFKSQPRELELSSAPKQPIIHRSEPNRPQPRIDRDNEQSMVVTVRRLRPCPLLDIRFVGLHHNLLITKPRLLAYSGK